jgi:hypothetical protein
VVAFKVKHRSYRGYHAGGLRSRHRDPGISHRMRIGASHIGRARWERRALYDERERAYRAYRRERLVTGSTGQLLLNPLRRAMSNFDSEIRQLEDRFGLNPLARARLGIQIGEAARTLADLNRMLEDDDA